MDEVNKIIQGDALSVLKTLPSESIDCCISSPPYWGLRDYGMEGQLGLEPTFQEYIIKLCDIYNEIKRVLKKEGTCWVNMGDTYGGSGGDSFKTGDIRTSTGIDKRPISMSTQGNKESTKDYQKCLLQIPSRFAIEMTDREWILRNELIWFKPNCMPSSADDRFTVDFEKIYFFVKNKKYWFERQFNPHEESSIERAKYKASIRKDMSSQCFYKKRWNVKERGLSNQGCNKRCVWKIPTQPYPEAHFATFPEKLIETPIKAGCPEFVCTKCGKGRLKMYKPDTGGTKGHSWHDHSDDMGKGNIKTQAGNEFKTYKRGNFIGYTSCSCNAEYKSGIVLDPFMGSGTVALMARKLNRNYIGIELSTEYIKLAEKRLQQQYFEF